ncbi:MAG: hypothetical protein MZV64_63235 [Ignavibacteriales bacterium]|nr:hypothetical protein [Ignavibacteriales bacterium]
MIRSIRACAIRFGEGLPRFPWASPLAPSRSTFRTRFLTWRVDRSRSSAATFCFSSRLMTCRKTASRSCSFLVNVISSSLTEPALLLSGGVP